MKKSRREFIKQLGYASTLLPTLPSLMIPSQALAASKPPLRLAIFFGFNGTKDVPYWPSVDATNQVYQDVFSIKLSQIINQKGQVSDVFGPSLNALSNKFSLVRGMCQAVSPYGVDNIVHDGASVLSLSHIHENADAYGFDAPKVGSSMDCIVENSAAFYDKTPSLKAIRIAGGEGKWTPSFWRPLGGSNPPYDQVQRLEYLRDDPQTIYNKLLGSVSNTPVTNTNTASYRGSAFELLLNQFNGLVKSNALSSADKQRLDSHTQFLAQVRDSVINQGGSAINSCSPPQLKAGTRVIDRWTNNLNSIAAAFACDTTRLSVFTMGSYDDDGKIKWNDDHSNSHNSTDHLVAAGLSTDGIANVAQWRGWQANRIADFMKALDAIKEADGSTVLDNTLIIWTNQHGGGHCISNYPMFIGGGAAGQFRMGEYLDYRNRSSDGVARARNLGRPLSNLWMAVMRSMGVTEQEYLMQGEDGAHGQAPRSGDRYVNGHDMVAGFKGDVRQLRREIIPYFYTGS